MFNKGNRANGIIDRLKPDLKDVVEQMLLSGRSYKDIVAYLGENDVQLSVGSVFRYAKRFSATLEQIRIANENFRMIREEMEKYPDLDMAEPLIRMASQSAFNAMTNLTEESWEGVPPNKLIQQITALVRAATYKQKVDRDIQTDTEKALEANKALLFDVLGKKHPELYQNLQAVLQAEKEAQNG